MEVNMKKKIIAMMLSIMAAFSMVACNGDPGSDVPSDVVEIVIPRGYGGGAGAMPQDKLAEAFNNDENWGKKKYGKYNGAYVKYVDGDYAYVDIQNAGFDVIHFDSRSPSIADGAAAGSYVDITDIVTSVIPTEDVSIEDKIDPEYRWVTKGATAADKDRYYGIPGSTYYSGISMDREFFERDQLFLAAAVLDTDADAATKLAKFDRADAAGYQYRKFHSSKFGITLVFSSYDGDGIGAYGQTMRNGQFNTSTEDLMVGPDGQKGTSDDGLPSSLVEMLALCDYVTQSDRVFLRANGTPGTTFRAPIGLSGQYKSQSSFILESLLCSMLGEQYRKSMLEYNSQGGTVNVITGWTDENLYPGIDYIKKPIVTKGVVVTPESGYLSTWIEEKFYADAALEIIMHENWYSYGYSEDYSHHEAEWSFLAGGYANMPDFEATLYFCDATHWSAEAREQNHYLTLAASYDYTDHENYGRRVEPAILPTNIHEPIYDGYTEGYGDIQTLTCGPLTYTCIITNSVKDDPDKLAACKAWLQFLMTDRAMTMDFIYAGSAPTTIGYDYYQALEQYPLDGFDDPYYANYYFLRTVDLIMSSRLCPSIGIEDYAVNYRTQPLYFRKMYYSGMFEVDKMNPYLLIQSKGAEKAFEAQMYTKATFSRLHSTYNEVPSNLKGDLVYNPYTGK